MMKSSVALISYHVTEISSLLFNLINLVIQPEYDLND